MRIRLWRELNNVPPGPVHPLHGPPRRFATPLLLILARFAPSSRLELLFYYQGHGGGGCSVSSAQLSPEYQLSVQFEMNTICGKFFRKRIIKEIFRRPVERRTNSKFRALKAKAASAKIRVNYGSRIISSYLYSCARLR